MKISFDFDSTLDMREVQDFVKKLDKNIHEIWIVTSRLRKVGIPSWNEDLLDTAINLGIPPTRIHFTEGADKYKFLRDNNFDIHLDDDVIELSLIESHTDCLPVCHWGWGEKYGGKDWKKKILNHINKQ